MRGDRDLIDPWEADDVAQRFASAPGETIIAWALEQWGSRIAVCTSFQAEGMVILDMACRIAPKVRVFTVDTGRLPLWDRTSEQLWDYTDTYDVPTHRLYQQGYSSIGCAPCTRPTQPGDDARAGRWWWEGNTGNECGIHGLASAGCGAS
jgi:3'-phosphoadenosine 5'-phosphosulfate sulfotransferase (PAPS reductase)/FAD synthetase